MERHLNHLGIKTIVELERFPADILKRKSGITGQHLHDMGLALANPTNQSDDIYKAAIDILDTVELPRNAVNNRYGDFTLTFASLMDTEEKGRHFISPAWRPDGTR
jgi:hypothetical protein